MAVMVHLERIMADWLEAVYTDSQGNEVPIPLEREVHLD